MREVHPLTPPWYSEFMRSLEVMAVVIGCFSFVACSSSSTSVGPGASDMDAGMDAPRLCTTLGYAGAAVDPVAVSGSAPTAAGGSIADGTYRLTSYTVYNNAIDPSKVQSLQASFKFAAGAYEIAFASSKGGEAKESGTVTTKGTLLQLTKSCPSTMTESERRYSATATRFDLFDVSDARPTSPTEVATYTRE